MTRRQSHVLRGWKWIPPTLNGSIPAWCRGCVHMKSNTFAKAEGCHGSVTWIQRNLTAALLRIDTFEDGRERRLSRFFYRYQLGSLNLAPQKTFECSSRQHFGMKVTKPRVARRRSVASSTRVQVAKLCAYSTGHDVHRPGAVHAQRLLNFRFLLP